MAFQINKSTISNENIQLIRSMLCLQPQVQRMYNVHSEPPDPVLFYVIEGDIIHLPFLFAGSLFQICPNINIPYPLTPLNFTGQLREHQIPVEQEAWNQLETYGTTTLGLYPGFGKTILGAKLAARAHLMTVVLVHREILTTQWKKTFEDYTNGRVWIVGEKNPPDVCDVIICMDTRYNQIPKYMRDSVGTLIIDEVHAFCTMSHVKCLLAFHPKNIILESGSIERDDKMECMAYAIAGEHGIYRESSKPFNVMKIITNTTPVRKQNRMGKTDWTALVKDTLMNERRNQIIINLIMANLTFKILVLTSLREHATVLHDCLDKIGIPCDYLCGTKRGYTDSTVLFATYQKVGTGFDPATSCPTYSGRPFDLLILVCSIKKPSGLTQNVGRVFRAEFPTVMHFVDNDDIYKSHYCLAKKWYIARGGILSEHNIPNTTETTSSNTTSSQKQQEWINTKTQQLTQNNPLTLNIMI